jgi:hypothetical protein
MAVRDVRYRFDLHITSCLFTISRDLNSKACATYTLSSTGLNGALIRYLY